MIRVITIRLQMSIKTLKSNDIDIYTPNIAKRMINLSNKHIQNNNPIQNDQIVIEKEYREKKNKGCMRKGTIIDHENYTNYCNRYFVTCEIRKSKKAERNKLVENKNNYKSNIKIPKDW